MPPEIITLTGDGREIPVITREYQLAGKKVEDCIANFEAKWKHKVEKAWIWQGNLYIEFDESWQK